MMRKIDKYNYEEFFLDYLEGNLNDADLNNLESFLALNPDLQKELDEMCLVELKEERVEFDKSSLKKIPFEADFEDFCVAKLEGDLEQEDEIAFNNYLNTNLIGRAQYQIFEKTKLKADLDVIYPDKEELQRKDRKIIPFWLLSGVGVAASVFILFSVWNSPISDNDTDQLSADKVAYIDTVKKIKIGSAESPETNDKLVRNVGISSVQQEKTPVVKNEPVAKINNHQTTESQIEKPVVAEALADNQTETLKSEPEKVSLPKVTQSTELEILANAEIAEHQIKTPNQQEEINEVPVNSGLANLGMSWKSSVNDKKKKNSLLYAVAKMGVDKLGDIAGKKVQLEKQYDSETEKTRVNFNTKGIGFSTSIK